MLNFLLGANRPGAKRLGGRNDQGRNDLGRNAAGAKRLGGELDLGRNDPDSLARPSRNRDSSPTCTLKTVHRQNRRQFTDRIEDSSSTHFISTTMVSEMFDELM